MEQVRRFVVPMIAVVVISTLIAACGESPTAPSHLVAYSQSDLQVGTGVEAVVSNRVTVNYTLWLYDPAATSNRGIQIESSVGGTPFSFVLGSGDVIEGWNRGVAGMRVGGVRRLVIPPSLAYGQDRKGIIPPNATLIFDIELLEVADS